MGVIFSITIALIPAPNEAGAFTLCVMCAGYIFFLPSATTIVWTRLYKRLGLSDLPANVQIGLVGVMFIAATIIIYYFGLEEFFIPKACIVIGIAMAAGVWLDASAVTEEDRRLKHASSQWPMETQCSTPTQGGGGNALKWARRVSWMLTAFYSFFAIMLGVMDMSNQEMYSSLNESGGSNHMLLPTGMVQQIFATSPTLAEWFPAANDVFGGGLVRVDHTDSKAINAIYPGETTGRLDSRVLEVLREIGHQAREFSFETGRVMGPGFGTPNPTGSAFVRYTVPALELRRMLAEAQVAGEAFSLVYSRPLRFTYPSIEVFEEVDSRKHLVEVTYKFDGKGQASCILTGGATCDPQEIAMLGPPRGWGAKVLIHNPHPISQGEHLQVCRN
ncbi:unnamed protein product [Polarella glacialis]|uniref:Uncharacterized protein n=1 Tax=Polarella glacialis TaxID=89957 RepID=A0A813KZ95_POLGL|nr:unnamed protein product [Polarella glacialis]